jgi:hypothetical protein
MQNSFIFYASFDEALKELPDKIRLKIYDAICDYALRGIEPEFSGIEKAVFSLIKPQISANLQKYKNGCRGAEFGHLGGRPKKPQENGVGDNDKNPKETPKKPQENPTRTPNENVNENVNVNVISPPLSPPDGGEGKNFKELFFEKYPALKCKKPKDDGIDYDVLIREFELSTTLRGMYSFPKVVAMYAAIKNGNFRDRAAGCNPAIEAINAKSAREKYYADKRAKAESVAYDYQKRAKANKRFCEIDRELAKLNLELAKAEVAGADVTELKEYQELLQAERGCILIVLGIEEWQLLPQYECEKCSDSGFLPDGRACDCYRGVREGEKG